MIELKDTGDYLEVPEDQQLDVDDFVLEEVNEDEGLDISGVPDGEYIHLSTSHLDEEEDH